MPETAAILNRASVRLQSPVLLMDALDESVFPSWVSSAIAQLSQELDIDWKFVVASRLRSAEELRRLPRFSVLEVHGLMGADAVDILRASHRRCLRDR